MNKKNIIELILVFSIYLFLLIDSFKSKKNIGIVIMLGLLAITDYIYLKNKYK